MEGPGGEGGGGGHGSGGGGVLVSSLHAYNYKHLQNQNLFFRPGPPLTAIDRFLCGQTHFAHHQQYAQNNSDNNQAVPSTNGFCTSFSLSDGTDAICQDENSWKPNDIDQGVSFFDGLFLDDDDDDGHHHEEQRLNRTLGVQERNSSDHSSGRYKADHDDDQVNKVVEEDRAPKVLPVGKRGTKRGSSQTIIKGQWTEEEDR